MGLSDYIMGIGKPVAYYPKIATLVDSVSAGVLLCQFLYWTSRTNDADGWFWKDSAELEEETGLTYNKQHSAREILRKLNLIDEDYKRLEHKMYYRVKQDVLNKMWEDKENKQTTVIPVKATPLKEDSYEKKSSKHTGKDLVDGFMELAQSPGVKKTVLKEGIESRIATRLGVNPSGRKWEDFINYAADRWTKDKQSIDKFIDWAIQNDFNPIYWTPDKMKTIWPSAFLKESLDKNEGFVVKSNPVKKEENFAPMPKNLIGK